MPQKKQYVEVEGLKFSVTNLDKILYPASGIIKAEIIQYYLEIAPVMLKFSKGRPISMLRYPDGIIAHKFYSKNAPEWRPDFIETINLEDDEINYIVIQHAADLVWLGNIASLENHGMNKRLNSVLQMDHIIFDLDPPEDFSYVELRDLSLDIVRFLEKEGYSCYVKTSGSRGAHIYLPIVASADFKEVIKKIKLLAKAIVKRFSKYLTSAFRKDNRKGKILLDINRNYEAQTTILPLSTRALARAPVSMPLSLDDFSKTLSSQDFTIGNARQYIEDNGYAWETFYDNPYQVLAKKTPLSFKPSQVPAWFVKAEHKHMLAGVTKTMMLSENLVYENKWDGIRVFIYVWQEQVKIISRSGNDITTLFPQVVESAKKLKTSAVLDGELVVIDAKGRPSFKRIISRLHSRKAVDRQIKSNPVILYVFDVLRAGEHLVIDEKWEKRRAILKKILLADSHFRLSECVTEGQLLYDAGRSMDLEGIMIKSKSGKYIEGKRSDNWRKMKYRDVTTCVILGFTEGEGSRAHFFGSLHIAELIEDNIVYRGRVGSGFNESQLKSMTELFKILEFGECWVEGEVGEKEKSKWFVNRFYVCEVSYAKITDQGHFREPVFKKLLDEILEI